ncbi:MAG: hypothetical protein AAFU85_27850 [Planctomycetota bacterium]
MARKFISKERRSRLEALETRRLLAAGDPVGVRFGSICLAYGDPDAQPTVFASAAESEDLSSAPAQNPFPSVTDTSATETEIGF